MKLTICGVEVVHLRGKMRVRMFLCGVQSITLWGWYGQSAGQKWGEIAYFAGLGWLMCGAKGR